MPSSTAYEAEYGCEHVGDALSSATVSQEGLSDSLQKTAVRAGASTRDASRVHYYCLQCLYTGKSHVQVNKHALKTKHLLSFEPRTSSIYCAKCEDLIYDPVLETVLRGGHHTPKKRKRDSIEDDPTSDALPRPCGREGVRGLFNLGETCYMNSILQMMIHNRLLSIYFLGNTHPPHTCPISLTAEAMMEEATDGASEDVSTIGEKSGGDYKPCVGCGVGEVFAESRMVEKSKPMDAVNLLFASWKNIPVGCPWESEAHISANSRRVSQAPRP